MTPGRSTTVAALSADAVRAARDVVAAMHALAARLAAAVDAGDAAASATADDAVHGVLVARAGNPAIAAVLDQYEPVLRRAERLLFLSVDGRASVDRHDRLRERCAAGDAEGAAAIEFATWHGIPVGED